MESIKNPSAGGRASEGGSSYRAGLAAYLAAHGLADVAVHLVDGASPGTPELMWFETSGEVDDLRCRFSRGSRWDIQAKRSCSWGRTFDAVTAQWVRAVRAGGLADEDRVALASGAPTGPLKELGAALRRLREMSEVELLPKESRQYLRFRELASTGGWLDIFDEVVAHAAIIDVAAETESDSAFREAAALLDGTVVTRGQGNAAINALARFFQTEAARAGASGPERWLRVLDDANIEPGPASSQASAGRIRALATYRERLASRLDMLDVDHLAAGVPPMPVPHLLGTFRVQLPDPESSNGLNSSAFAHVARRWPRLTVIGLPGAGKSTAIEQLAADWAGDVEAPMPIVVRLHRVVEALRAGQWVQLDDVVGAGDGVSAGLVPLLVELLRNGTAVLLLDGLDECRDQQGQAVNLIRRLADDLHPESGLIVSARDAASDLAIRTGLPLTTLAEPLHLSDHVQRLVDHVFDTATSDSGVDNARARQWIKKSQSSHPDIWRIPLFAVLLAFHAAQTRGEQLPASRAAALTSAIRDSVTRWEQQKAHDPAAWHPDLHPNLLLDGFADIGHAITEGDTEISSATTAVSETITEEWGYAPTKARAIAEDVLRWWLDRVGAFTLGDGVLRARVRMMGEVGDAMWAARQSPAGRLGWLERVLADVTNLREPALLAAALEPGVINELIAAANLSDAALLAADAVLEGARPSDSSLEALVDNLATLASDPQPIPEDQRTTGTADDLIARMDELQARHDGPAWRYQQRLARLPLPQDLRPVRDGVISEIVNVERQTVATALAVAADCAYDDRAATDPERAILETLLSLPIPNREPVEYKRSRRHISLGSSDPILSGRSAAVVSAIRLVGLTADTASKATRLAGRVSLSEAETLMSEISRGGFEGELRRSRIMSGAFKAMEHLLRDEPGRDSRFILEEACALSSARSTAPVRAYRLTAVAALFEILKAGDYAVGVGARAVDRYPHLLRHLIRMAVTVLEYKVERIADEAQRSLSLFDVEPLDTAVLLHVPPDPLRKTSLATPAMDDEDRLVLRSCITSGNDWLFWLAASWLAEAGEPGVIELWEALSSMTPAHRGAVADWVADAMRRPDAYARWLDGADPILRVVGAHGIAKTGEDAMRIRALAGDVDLIVRIEVMRALSKSGHDELFDEALGIAVQTQPDVWTCRWCGSIESMEFWDCTSCTAGDRPDLDEEIRRLRS